MKITLACITGRREPCLPWLIKSLAPQISDEKVDLLIIDRLGRSPKDLDIVPEPWFIPRVISPKPTPWQGPHRVAREDWWAKSNAINTALVYANTDYIAFIDDACHVAPTWLACVREGYRRRESVLAGSYEKIEGDRRVFDHRLERAKDGRIDCGGGWLYGCTFALPLKWALDVNGAEEGCDGMGGEDYIMGYMLENAGHRIDYSPRMHVIQERRELAQAAGPSIPLRRADPGESPLDKSHAALERFRKRRRTEFTAVDLTAARKRRLTTGDPKWPMPDADARDWFNNSLIREVV